MLERLKWLTIMVTIAVIMMGAQTILEHYINQSALAVEPARSSPVAPSATLPPTKTTSPSNTETEVSGVQILEIGNDSPGGDLAGEYVLIENRLSRPIDLGGWTLRDDQKNIYTFPRYSLGAGKEVRVWSRVGVDRIDNLYWNLTAKVWNTGGDCGYLRNADGDLQNYICY